jgi:hypothetical protein
MMLSRPRHLQRHVGRHRHVLSAASANFDPGQRFGLPSRTGGEARREAPGAHTLVRLALEAVIGDHGRGDPA